jgi:hypothetical protein
MNKPEDIQRQIKIVEELRDICKHVGVSVSVREFAKHMITDDLVELAKIASKTLSEEQLRLDMMEEDYDILGDLYTWAFPPCPGCGDPAGECENQSCVRMEEEQETYQ